MDDQIKEYYNEIAPEIIHIVNRYFNYNSLIDFNDTQKFVLKDISMNNLLAFNKDEGELNYETFKTNYSHLVNDLKLTKPEGDEIEKKVKHVINFMLRVNIVALFMRINNFMYTLSERKAATKSYQDISEKLEKVMSIVKSLQSDQPNNVEINSAANTDLEPLANLKKHVTSIKAEMKQLKQFIDTISQHATENMETYVQIAEQIPNIQIQGTDA
jgi:hypothetical protein